MDTTREPAAVGGEATGIIGRPRPMRCITVARCWTVKETDAMPTRVAPWAMTAIAAILSTGLSTALSTGNAMAQDRILMTSDWGNVTADLADNAAARALLRMLPLTIAMGDHLRQEKTGPLPAPLPETPRQRGFSAGTLGLWGPDDFVIYYRDGRVPPPGIVVLGTVTGDVSIFDRPGPVSVRVQPAQ